MTADRYETTVEDDGGTGLVVCWNESPPGAVTFAGPCPGVVGEAADDDVAPWTSVFAESAEGWVADGLDNGGSGSEAHPRQFTVFLIFLHSSMSCTRREQVELGERRKERRRGEEERTDVARAEVLRFFNGV